MCGIWNEYLMDEKVDLATKRKWQQKVRQLMGLCVWVFIFCKLMELKNYVVLLCLSYVVIAKE